MSRNQPLISEESAHYLAKVVNRAAESFDVSALSTEEAVEVFTLLDRLTQKLWDEHKRVLVSLYQSIFERRGLSEDDEDDEDEEDGSDLH
ncbi:MAG: hypothetical protein MJE77_35075 [Proteobacteria bacterium]|nr:hypothetical protein [Pseudomonadota bacterium]